MILLGIMRSMLLSAICMHLPVHFAIAIETVAAAHPVPRFFACSTGEPAEACMTRRSMPVSMAEYENRLAPWYCCILYMYCILPLKGYYARIPHLSHQSRQIVKITALCPLDIC